MDLFGAVIETFALTSMGWLLIEFAGFSWQRGSKPKTNDEVLEQAIAQYNSVFSDAIVAFRRTGPKPNDRDLIRFAKSIKFPGSRKWSFDRKLSSKVRSELQQLWNEQRQLKAG